MLSRFSLDLSQADQQWAAWIVEHSTEAGRSFFLQAQPPFGSRFSYAPSPIAQVQLHLAHASVIAFGVVLVWLGSRRRLRKNAVSRAQVDV